MKALQVHQNHEPRKTLIRVNGENRAVKSQPFGANNIWKNEIMK